MGVSTKHQGENDDMDDNYGYICVDCAMWQSNADSSGISEELVEAVTSVEEHWSVDCGEDGEHCVGFSMSPCDCCGSRLAGARHRAAII